MTVESITNKARRILQDTVEPYRWLDDEIREYIDEGIVFLHRVRPETRYVNGLLNDRVELPAPEDDDQRITLDACFEDVLVCYTVYKCYLVDDTDTVNSQLAEMYLQKFNTKAQL